MKESRTMKRAQWFILCVLLGLSAVSCRKAAKPAGTAPPAPSTGRAENSDTIRVGLIAPLTGKY